ncbi:DUF6460 domain-containing protein [Devosia sp. YIM 151766]|uniref:DUF6460 domain-containing protein n=1 Tax=Devosia sp. YIM 151766 TaxID=3017325 RepID=UPI00255C5DFB|nr:DUF6460 domain-containing protein [Devosia sp. YIM 151766]WIY53296.1 DUF6460 domain-containing protein [Devosia sp. YIM 151766]
MTEDTTQRTRSGLERVMGGRPASVVIKLVLLSLLVGFVMSVFGFNAADLVRGAVEMVREAIRDGAGMFRQLGAYVLAGAAIVVPVWLLLRLTRGR